MHVASGAHDLRLLDLAELNLRVLAIWGIGAGLLAAASSWAGPLQPPEPVSAGAGGPAVQVRRPVHLRGGGRSPHQAAHGDARWLHHQPRQVPHASWVRRVRAPYRGEHQDAGRDHRRACTTSRSIRAAPATPAARPNRSAPASQQRPRLGVRDLPARRPGRGAGGGRAGPGPGVGELLDVAGGDVEDGHLGVGRQQLPGAVDARLPGSLGDPDQRAHQITRKANHNATGGGNQGGRHGQRSELEELAEVDLLVVGVDDPPPQQRGQRPT